MPGRRALRAHHLEVAVTELDGEGGEEGEEEHDQRPLALRRVHVEPLSHQREVCRRRVKGEILQRSDDGYTTRQTTPLKRTEENSQHAIFNPIPSKDTEDHAERDGAGQQEAEGGGLPPLVPQVDPQGDVGLDPAEQRPQDERQEGAEVVHRLLGEKLKPKPTVK